MLARLLVALRSKKGFFGALVLFGYAAYGVVAILGNAETVADNLAGALQFLATGPGVLSAVSGAVLLILWALVTQSPETDESSSPTSANKTEQPRTKLREVEQERDEAKQEIERLRIELNNRPPRHFNTPVEIVETLTPAKAKEMEGLKAKNTRLQEQIEKAAIEAGLPPNVATERHIANCDFHIYDLLRLAGEGYIIEGKIFENCTISGPGVISTFEDVRPPEKRPNNSSLGSTYDTDSLSVEGKPESVLCEVPWESEGVNGVIYLVGCAFTRVAFKNIGIAGSPDEIKFWRENVRFRRRGSASHLGMETRWEVVREEDSEG